MNVRLTPAGKPNRQDLYAGVKSLIVSVDVIELHYAADVVRLSRVDYERFEVDEGGAVS